MSYVRPTLHKPPLPGQHNLAASKAILSHGGRPPRRRRKTRDRKRLINNSLRLFILLVHRCWSVATLAEYVCLAWQPMRPQSPTACYPSPQEHPSHTERAHGTASPLPTQSQRLSCDVACSCCRLLCPPVRPDRPSNSPGGKPAACHRPTWTRACNTKCRQLLLVWQHGGTMAVDHSCAVLKAGAVFFFVCVFWSLSLFVPSLVRCSGF